MSQRLPYLNSVSFCYVRPHQPLLLTSPWVKTKTKDSYYMLWSLPRHRDEVSIWSPEDCLVRTQPTMTVFISQDNRSRSTDKLSASRWWMSYNCMTIIELSIETIHPFFLSTPHKVLGDKDTLYSISGTHSLEENKNKNRI